MLKTIEIQSSTAKETATFGLESLKKVHYFEAYFSERWKTSEECVINSNEFTVKDLKILIEQIIEQSMIDPLQIHYNQLPSIIACAGFLSYPIDLNIIITFMGKCVPIIPWKTLYQWMISYNTDSHQVLIKAIDQFITKQRAFSEENQKEILLTCVENGKWPFRTWPFQTWFVNDKIFLEIWCDEFNDYAEFRKSAKPKYVFLWELLCRNDLAHLWSQNDIIDKITWFLTEEKGSDAYFDLRINMLKSIIKWGMEKKKTII